MDNSILKIEDLSVAFQQYVSFFEFGQTVPIKKMDMELNRGEILVVVGQSGSGKSLVAHAIMDILPENAVIGGHIYYNGEELKKERR
ncbi:MAG: ATP-binding cassette domain-containing protein, partial [Dialister sp.]|nr:ATP-binding cassette domain-containing protein [Dialister sp.]